MKLRSEYTCPLELTHDITRGKWKPIILWQLSKNPKSLSQLEKEIKGISQKMLLQQINELLEYSVIDKKMFEGYPLRSEYHLTERGMKLMEALTIMQGVGMDMLKESGAIE